MKSPRYRSDTILQGKRRAVCLDFDGTVCSGRSFDSVFVQKLSSEYDQVVVTSNNSSISHKNIKKLFSGWKNIAVMTPQLLARHIINKSSGNVITCTSSCVMVFLHGGHQITSTNEDPSLLKALEESIELKDFLQDIHDKKVLIAGRVSLKILIPTIQYCNLHKVTLVAMNLDKKIQSHGISSTTSGLLGDMVKTHHCLNKTSEIYMSVLRCYLQDKCCEAAVVVGDNTHEDYLLAQKLGARYIPRVFRSASLSDIMS